MSIATETQSRRTFAIISHPDAGKTTLTEKLLLYSGLVRSAGMVRAKKGGKSATSDWMAMEQERGISITASALQFKYKDVTINLLDTPGHQDFSEDTYRTLMAADSAVMVLDAAKGVETQTRKLFSVCRMRQIPILTFINKMDLPAKDPFELLQEVEQVLGIAAVPINWPIGAGRNFAGVVDVDSKEVLLFERSEVGGAKRAQMVRTAFDELRTNGAISETLCEKVTEDLALITGAGIPFDLKKFLAGEVTPVFFGSALTNFGVEPFFDSFLKLAPAPSAYTARTESGGEIRIDPIAEPFSAFIFKIQANMNPKHRDSMAFMRVCSGVFEREMVVKHHRLKKEMRLARSYSIVAQDRNTVEEAFPGDIVGVINPGAFQIGDTISTHGGFTYQSMARFAPELFAHIRPLDVLRKKAFDKGIAQLSSEGAIQILRSFNNPDGPPFVAAVGRLQFDVLQYRLRAEYSVETELEVMTYKTSAWLEGDPRTLKVPQGQYLALDAQSRVMILFSSEWERRFVVEKNPEHILRDTAVA
jgi:peptide chain release factor 3